jgi:formyltetrahydrofolate deformylase
MKGAKEYILTLSCPDATVISDEMTAAGRDVECMVLARAVRWHTEHRVLLNGHKTVVFR